MTTDPMAFDTSHNSPGSDLEADGFLLRMDRFGSSLHYSTFIGGSLDDQCSTVAIDRNGNAYVAGYPLSPNLPRTTSRTYGGGKDAFVAKFNATGTNRIYLTYLGNTGPNTIQVRPPRPIDDIAVGIAVDSVGNAFVTGTTTSEAFPITASAFDRVVGAGFLRIIASPRGDPDSSFIESEDIFVTKFNADGSQLLYSTYVGGDFSDFAGGTVLIKGEMLGWEDIVRS